MDAQEFYVQQVAVKVEPGTKQKQRGEKNAHHVNRW